MGDTGSPYNLPFPELTDVPNVPQDIEDLALDVHAELALLSSRFATVLKTGTESLTSSTGLQDDDELTIPVLASTSYVAEVLLNYDGATGGDLKWALAGPAGASAAGQAIGLNSVATSQADVVNHYIVLGGAMNHGALGAGTTVAAMWRGMLNIGGTAGNFKVQWAQVASSATATRVFANSHIWLCKV